MRKWNGWISLAIIALLLLHGITGGFQLLGVMAGGKQWRSVLSYAMAAFLCVHMIIGIYLTWDGFRKGGWAHVLYKKENLAFWTRRISGLAIVLFGVYHALFFSQRGDGAFRLKLFEGPQLAASLLLVAAVAVHLLSNIRPLLITFGARRVRKLLGDILFLLAVVMLFAAVAFIVYYLRWNYLWK